MGLVRVPVGELRVSVTAEAAHWLAVERERERERCFQPSEGGVEACLHTLDVCVWGMFLSQCLTAIGNSDWPDTFESDVPSGLRITLRRCLVWGGGGRRGELDKAIMVAN